MAIDPVCKMKLEPAQAAAKAVHAGQVYYFCSVVCHKAFMVQPEKYVGKEIGGSQGHGGSRHGHS